MGVVGLVRVSRSVVAWFFSILIIIFAFVAILIFKNIRNHVVESTIKLVPFKTCAIETQILPKNAYEDFNQAVDKQKGLMSCLCYNHLK